MLQVWQGRKTNKNTYINGGKASKERILVTVIGRGTGREVLGRLPLVSDAGSEPWEEGGSYPGEVGGWGVSRQREQHTQKGPCGGGWGTETRPVESRGGGCRQRMDEAEKWGWDQTSRTSPALSR